MQITNYMHSAGGLCITQTVGPGQYHLALKVEIHFQRADLLLEQVLFPRGDIIVSGNGTLSAETAHRHSGIQPEAIQKVFRTEGAGLLFRAG
jgi:hypothetical protein